MPRIPIILAVALALGAPSCAAPPQEPPDAGAAAPAAVEADLPPANRPSPEKDAWMDELSNAGRWGAGDQRGTLNLVTPGTRLDAVGLVETGEVVSLMRPVALTPKSAAIAADDLPDGNPYYELRARVFPPESRYAGFTSDIQEYAVHGALLTHVDALCHDSYDGRMYNDVPVAGTITGEGGCAQLGLGALAGGLVTRGVLVDFPRLRGRALEAGERLTPGDMEAWEAMAGVTIGAGDAVLLYTGLTAGEPALGAGFDLSMMPWLRARDVALAGADGPNADHQVSLSALGMPLLDNAELGGLAETAARLGRWEFLLMVAPAGPAAASGAPVNPLAVF